MRWLVNVDVNMDVDVDVGVEGWCVAVYMDVNVDMMWMYLWM